MKKAKILLISAAAILLAITFWYLINRFTYSKELAYYPVQSEKDSSFSVGIIGDSWAAGKKLDSVIHFSLLAENINNKVVSSGHPGAKSKKIYQNLFCDEYVANSSKFIIKGRPNCCIVIAGVNDAIGQVGAKFYSHHMIMIIKTLLYYNIKPIIVELPEFGIVEATNNCGIFKNVRNKLFAKITNHGNLNNIICYRDYFVKELSELHLKESLVYVKFENICSCYSKCAEIYRGTSHLNIKGNIILGNNIVEAMLKDKNLLAFHYKFNH